VLERIGGGARLGSLAALCGRGIGAFGVPADWIARVIDAESGGEPMLGGRLTVSPAGAMGLMQLMPGTWCDMRSRLGLGPDPYDPRDNILAGTLYLRLLYDRFGYPGLFAAYNAGPARYAAHLTRGRPLPAETRGYLATVAGGSEGPGPAMRPPAAADIFFRLSGAHAEPAPASSPPSEREAAERAR
jgi:soluble lytic murein transglycosylase-like protein